MTPKTVALEPLAVPAAYELVVERLRRAIHLGVYRPGDKLPSGRLHAEQLGVSRVTLREAIRVLEGEGFLETKRGSAGGAIVTERVVSVERVRGELRERHEELRGILNFLLANERCAAERAATRLTGDDVAELEASIEALRESTSIGEFRQADSSFHLRIAQAADCALLRQAVEDGRASLFMPLDVLDFDLMHPVSLKAHSRILEALKTGDPSKAGRAMTAHLRFTGEELDSVLGVN